MYVYLDMFAIQNKNVAFPKTFKRIYIENMFRVIFNDVTAYKP